MVHDFDIDAGGIALPGRFTNPFCYEPHPLAIEASRGVMRYLASRAEWLGELSLGKMFGVLVVRRPDGTVGYLAAFSGNLAGSNRHDYFVPPVYDMLRPDGRFRLEEERISRINRQLDAIEHADDYRALHAALERVREEADEAVAAHKALMARSKARRDAARASGTADADALVHESQWMKAELRRIKARGSAAIADAETAVRIIDDYVDELREERRRRSVALQKWLFDQFVMLNARGERRTLSEIFATTPQQLPPAGAGECAAPKLLQYAFASGLRPVAMAEFWYGQSPVGEVRHHAHFYPACHGKCRPILGFMLQGLDVEPEPVCDDFAPVRVIYSDEHIVAVENPSGMLTVPGKIASTSLHERLTAILGCELHVVHRLDMDTSGIVVFAKDAATHKALQRQFAWHTVRKEYVALLGGAVSRPQGVIELPLCPDVEHRPQQMVSREHGKHAVTRYEVTPLPAGELAELRRGGVSGEVTRVRFIPLTGRTHQLRVHAAHRLGLNAPILGDRIYGRNGGAGIGGNARSLVAGRRLCLHAEVLALTHPATGAELLLTAPSPF